MIRILLSYTISQHSNIYIRDKFTLPANESYTYCKFDLSACNINTSDYRPCNNYSKEESNQIVYQIIRRQNILVRKFRIVTFISHRSSKHLGSRLFCQISKYTFYVLSNSLRINNFSQYYYNYEAFKFIYIYRSRNQKQMSVILN